VKLLLPICARGRGAFGTLLPGSDWRVKSSLILLISHRCSRRRSPLATDDPVHRLHRRKGVAFGTPAVIAKFVAAEEVLWFAPRRD